MWGRLGLVAVAVLAGACSGGGGSGVDMLDRPAGVVEGRVLEAGTSQEGELAEGERQTHLFQGVEGQRVLVGLSALEGSWDTYLRVYDPGGGLVAENDDGGEGLNSLVVLLVAETGRHRAEVGSFNDRAGGKYRLSVDLDRVPGEGRELLAADGVVDPGDAEAARFAFQGAEGATVTIAVNADSTDLDPVVELLGPDGTPVGRDDDGGEGYNSLLTATLGAGGTYVAVVTGFGADDLGPFRIRVTQAA